MKRPANRDTRHSRSMRACLLMKFMAACLLFGNIDNPTLLSGAEATKIRRHLPTATICGGSGCGGISSAASIRLTSSRSSTLYGRRLLDELSPEGFNDSSRASPLSSTENRSRYSGGPYLVTFFGLDAEDETLRMMHFLHHYLDKLSVRPDRCIFVLHSRRGETGVAEGRSILASRGIEPKRVVLGRPFDVRADTVLVRRLLVEEHVTTADKWVIRVDSDELLRFTDAEEMNRTWRRRSPPRCNHFRLPLVDRIAPNGDLPRIQPLEMGGTLFEQFPLKCWLTKGIVQAKALKVSIHDGTIRTLAGHHAYDRANSRSKARLCRNTLPHLEVSHFKWVSSVRRRVEQRQEEYRAKGYNWWVESARVFEYLKNSNGQVDIDKFCVNSTNI